MPFGNRSPISSRELRACRERLSYMAAQLQQDLDQRYWPHGHLALGSNVSPQTVFDWITETCITTFDCRQVSLLLLDGTRELRVRSAKGYLDTPRAVGTRGGLGEGILVSVVESGQALILGSDPRQRTHKTFETKAHPHTAAMVVPLVLGDQLIGVLSISKPSLDGCYSAEYLRSLRFFAKVAVTSCRQAMRIEEIREIIQTLDGLLVDREPEVNLRAA